MNEIVAGLFKTLAPTVASALLGPLGGVAVAAITKILGIGDGKVESISKAFNDGKITPDQLAEIKKLELQYQNDEKERGFKYAEIEYKNVQGAREMQIATKSVFPAVLSTIVTIGFFGTLAAMLYDDAVINSPPLLIMLGALGAEFGAVCKFWLGGNSGSEHTKELLAQMTPSK